MVARQVREDAGGEPHVGDAVQHERVRRDFHRAGLAAALRPFRAAAAGFPEASGVVCDASRSSAAAGPTRNVTVPSRPHGRPAASKHRRQQIGRRRLAVGAGDADDRQRLARMAVEDRGQFGERQPRVRRAQPGHDCCSAGAGVSATIAAAPRRSASAANVAPSARWPRMATNTVPARDRARVVRDRR